MSKVPEGVRVMIDDDCEVYSLNLIDLSYEKPNGYAFTHEQLQERDKAIARAAFKAAQKGNYVESLMTGGKYFKHDQTADDYLQSEEFKELTQSGLIPIGANK